VEPVTFGERRKPLPRGGPIARKTELRNTTPLAPGGALARTPLTPGSQPTRKPLKAAWTPPGDAEKNAKNVVEARSRGACEVCLQPGDDWSHRIGAGVGGPWTPENGVYMCRAGHAALHRERNRANDGGWHLWSWQDPPGQWPVWLATGWVHLLPDGTTRPAPHRPRPLWLPCGGRP
jgi:hypothetical protein